MNSQLLQFLFGAGCIATGFFGGLSLSWRQFRIAGHQVDIPALPHTDRQQAFVLVTVAMLSVVSTVYVAMATMHQAGCNHDFKTSLVARSAITTENTQHLNQMLFAIADNMSHPQPNSRAVVEQAILDYRVWAQTADKRREDNPIADPRCED